MRSLLSVRRLLAATTIFAGALGLPLVAATAASAAAPPSITANPSSGLTSGETVQVSGSGFLASSTVYIRECSALTGVAACDATTQVTATSGADGSLAATGFVVETGTVGSGSCSSASSCYIVASTDSTFADSTQTADAPITFAPPSITVDPNTGLTNGQTVTVAGVGFPAKAETVYVLECSALTGQAACDTGTLQTGTTQADGSFTGLMFTVETGTVGTGTCSSAGPCYIVASTDPTGQDTSQEAFAPITFAATAGPTITATPHSSLTNGEQVSVSGSGFASKAESVYVEQCSSLSGQAACDTSNTVMGTTTATGTFSGVDIDVHTGTVGSGTCSSASPCYLVASTDPTFADATQTADTPITFASTAPPGAMATATPNGNLKDGQVITVSGSGYPKKAEAVYVLECSSLTGGQAACDTSTLAEGTTTAAGTFSNVKLTVADGSTFSSSGATGSCQAGKTCYVVASTDPTGKDTSQIGVAPITFASTTSVATATTAAASKHSVKHGAKFAIKGNVKASGTGVAGIAVSLDIVKGNKLHKVAGSKTGSGGKFTFRLKGPKNKTDYVVKAKTTTEGTTIYKSSTSKVVKVK